MTIGECLLPNTVRSAILLLIVAATSAVPASRAAGAECVPAASTPTPGAPDGCTCQLSSVTFEAPNCEIYTRSIEDERHDFVKWQNSAWYEVLVITPPRPLRFKGYLARWQHDHKCTVEVLRGLAPTRSQASPATHATDSMPQIIWSGSCAAGEVYVIRAIAIGKSVIEFHVWRNSFQAGPPLKQVLADWLDHVQISPEARLQR